MITPYPQNITSKEIIRINRKNLFPFYLYDEGIILNQIKTIQDSFQDINFTLRYAVKANSHPYLLRFFDKQKVHFDASSIYEVIKLRESCISPKKIMLTSQEWAIDFAKHFSIKKNNFFFNASSLNQIEKFGQLFPHQKIGIRINPGQGSGLKGRTNVAGKNSSFGIWHQHIKQAKKLARQYFLTIKKIHTHIGSGTNPTVWEEVSKISINLLRHFPESDTINLGGGFKVARNLREEDINFKKVAQKIKKNLSNFEKKEKRKIHLEIEPGTFLMANSAILVSTINDIVEMGNSEIPFLKLNIGLNDFIRPSLYGAQHHMEVLTSSKKKKKYLIVGHCCEETDIIYTKSNQPTIKEPLLLKQAQIGDIFIIHGVGAYTRAMSSQYNSYPFLDEFVKKKKSSKIIQISKRKRFF